MIRLLLAMRRRLGFGENVTSKLIEEFGFEKILYPAYDAEIARLKAEGDDKEAKVVEKRKKSVEDLVKSRWFDKTAFIVARKYAEGIVKRHTKLKPADIEDLVQDFNEFLFVNKVPEKLLAAAERDKRGKLSEVDGKDIEKLYNTTINNKMITIVKKRLTARPFEKQHTILDDEGETTETLHPSKGDTPVTMKKLKRMRSRLMREVQKQDKTGLLVPIFEVWWSNLTDKSATSDSVSREVKKDPDVLAVKQRDGEPYSLRTIDSEISKLYDVVRMFVIDHATEIMTESLEDALNIEASELRISSRSVRFVRVLFAADDGGFEDPKKMAIKLLQQRKSRRSSEQVASELVRIANALLRE